MDLLQKLIDVSLVFDVPPPPRSETAAHAGEEEEEGMSILPRQPLHGTLTVSFDNADGAKTATATSFLSQVGEHSFPVAWHHLLGRLTLVPFLLDRADTDDGGARRDNPPSPSSATPALPPHEQAPPPSAKGPASAGAFVFGVPTFWNDKLFAHAHEEGGDDEELAAAAGHAGEDTGLLTAGRDGGHLPCRTAGEAFEVDAAGAKTVITPGPSSTGDGGGIPARVVGTYDFEFTVPEVRPLYLGRPAAMAFVLLLSPLAPWGSASGDRSGGGRLPGASAAAPPSAPDDWPPYQRYMAMRVLARAFVNPFDPATGGLASRFNMHTILLGCQYLAVTVKRALACQSVVCPLSNDRLLLNLNIVNVSRSPVILHSASLDVYSTCTTSPSPSDATSTSSGGPRRTTPSRHALRPTGHDERLPQGQNLWAEQRAGPAGDDMRTVDVLTKIVTVTPMVVSDDRPPFTLHAGETYSFQFIMEVLPQLCYLLNPKSLQYVYAKHAKQRQRSKRLHEEQSGRHAVGNGGEQAVGGAAASAQMAAPGGSGGGVEAAITDCFGEAVSNEEVVSVLSATYLSHLFVYYDILPSSSDRESSGRDRPTPAVSSVKADGLHLRHAAKWSFGAS